MGQACSSQSDSKSLKSAAPAVPATAAGVEAPITCQAAGKLEAAHTEAAASAPSCRKVCILPVATAIEVDGTVDAISVVGSGGVTPMPDSADAGAAAAEPKKHVYAPTPARPGAVIPELSQTPDSQTPSLLSPAVNQAPDDVHQQMTQGQGQEQQGKGDPDEHGQQEQEREAHSASATKAAHPPTAAQHTLAPLAEDTPMPPEALAVAAPAEEGHGNGGGGGGVCSSKRSTAEDPARASFDGSVVSEGPGGHDRRASRAQTCKTDATTVADTEGSMLETELDDATLEGGALLDEMSESAMVAAPSVLPSRSQSRMGVQGDGGDEA